MAGSKKNGEEPARPEENQASSVRPSQRDQDSDPDTERLRNPFDTNWPDQQSQDPKPQQ